MKSKIVIMLLICCAIVNAASISVESSSVASSSESSFGPSDKESASGPLEEDDETSSFGADMASWILDQSEAAGLKQMMLLKYVNQLKCDIEQGNLSKEDLTSRLDFFCRLIVL